MEVERSLRQYNSKIFHLLEARIVWFIYNLSRKIEIPLKDMLKTLLKTWLLVVISVEN